MNRRTIKSVLLVLCSVLMTMVLSGCVLNSYYITFDDGTGYGYLVHDTGISENYIKSQGQTPEEYFAAQLAEDPRLYRNTVNGVTYYYTEQARKDPSTSFSWNDYKSVAGEDNPLIKRTEFGEKNGLEYIDLYLTIDGLDMTGAEGNADAAGEFRDEFCYYATIDTPGTPFRTLEAPCAITIEEDCDDSRLSISMPVLDETYEVKVSFWITNAGDASYPQIFDAKANKGLYLPAAAAEPSEPEDPLPPEMPAEPLPPENPALPENPADPETPAEPEKTVSEVMVSMDEPKAGMDPWALTSVCKVSVAGTEGQVVSKTRTFDSNQCTWLRYIGDDPQEKNWMSYEVEEMEDGDTFKIGEWYRCGYYVDLDGVMADPEMKASINEGKGSSYWVDLSEDEETGIYLYWTYGPVADPFKDVPKAAYYKNAVEWAFNHEPQITDGMSPTSFGPDKTCTRGQVVTFLWRAAGCPKPETKVNPFADVKESDYFYEPVLWAVEQGITDGTTPTTFSPAKTCKNNHILTFIWRSVGKPGNTDNLVWYADAYKWAETNGLLTGTFEGEYNVNNECPRRDVVEYLYRHFHK